MANPTVTNVPADVTDSLGVRVKWKEFVFNMTDTVQTRPSHNGPDENVQKFTAKDYNTITMNRTYAALTLTVSYDKDLWDDLDEIWKSNDGSNTGTYEVYDSKDSTAADWSATAVLGGVTQGPQIEIGGKAVPTMQIQFNFPTTTTTSGGGGA